MHVGVEHGDEGFGVLMLDADEPNAGEFGTVELVVLESVLVESDVGKGHAADSHRERQATAQLVLVLEWTIV